MKPENRRKQGARRTPKGRFAAGSSGNPGGRPREVAEIRALAREHGEKALEKLVALLDTPNERVRLEAIRELLDRGYGRPNQAIDLSVVDGELAARIGELSDEDRRIVAGGDMRPLLKRGGGKWTK